MFTLAYLFTKQVSDPGLPTMETPALPQKSVAMSSFKADVQSSREGAPLSSSQSQENIQSTPGPLAGSQVSEISVSGFTEFLRGMTIGTSTAGVEPPMGPTYQQSHVSGPHLTAATQTATSSSYFATPSRPSM